MSALATDVRCLQYMPLQIERLRRSKAWLRCKRRPEMAFYLMNLWMRAWHELPAGSLEDDDDVLADAAMCDPDQWGRIREEILAGWELRDGRYHHPVVTELATEAASKLRKNVSRTAAARDALARKQSEGSDNDSEAPVTELVTSPEGKGREEKKEIEDKPLSPPAGKRPARKSSHDADFEAWWLIYPKRVAKEAARKAYFRAVVGNRASVEDLSTGAARYAAERLGQDAQFTKAPATWLNAGCWADEKPSEQMLAAPATGEVVSGRFYAKQETPQFEAWADYRRRTGGKPPPTDRNGGWFFDSEWPPDQTFHLEAAE